jgi:hypothetical protein
MFPRKAQHDSDKADFTQILFAVSCQCHPPWVSDGDQMAMAFAKKTPDGLTLTVSC